MKLVNFKSGDKFVLGVSTDKGIIEVGKLASALGSANVPTTMDQAVKGGKEAVASVQALVKAAQEKGQSISYIAENGITYGPSNPLPGKIICVGLNYKKHAEETNSPIPDYPVLFSKFENAIAAHKETVPVPNSDMLDYEAELAIIIGKQAKEVGEDEALDYVLGYSTADDLSARDLQGRTSQWILGKTCDGFCPVGPYLVTADEVGNPNQLNIRLEVNGVQRQNSNTKDMIFSCKKIVSYISQYMTLKPGDLILTGTPEGVIVGYPQEKRVWLKSGDTITVEIEKLGKLTNTLK